MTRALAMLALLLLAGCRTSTVTLLDGEAGNPAGAVAVIDPKSGEDRALIATAGSRARVNGARSRVQAGDAAAAEAANRDVLDTLPRPALRFVLNFLEGSTTLAPESVAVGQQLIDEIRDRGSAVDVQIEGHTDREGSTTDNDRLSRQRALAARDALVAEGLIPQETRVVGRGERAPLAGHATDDGVADPANRRVEVVVR